MAENSKIEWTDHTFNPWIGCMKVSPACDNCYAEAWDIRFKGDRWGAHAARTKTSAANWKKPLKWQREAERQGIRLKVFCASLADVFDNHKSIQHAWRDALWELIRQTPNLDWLLLTKRSQNIKKYLPEDWGDGYPNVWLGTTVENETEADKRIPSLLRVPAVVHFLSVEPLLESLPYFSAHVSHCPTHDFAGGFCSGPCPDRRYIKWVIVGGESGDNPRPMDADWIRSIRDDCAHLKIPFFFKQWGGKDKKAAGRILDGETYSEFPEVKND